MCGNLYGVIAAGCRNCMICIGTDTASTYNFIGAGACNVIRSCVNALGVDQPVIKSTILAGKFNLVQSSNAAATGNGIVAGTNNTLNRRTHAATGGYNSIAGNEGFSFGNTITGGSEEASFGDISKSTNNFSIDHPNPSLAKTHNLFHTSVESPSAGENIYRYIVRTNNGVGEVELPDYFKHLNECPQVWVTPKDGFARAYATVDQTLSKVKINSSLDGEFHLLVIGTRKDLLALKAFAAVEIMKPTS